MPESTQTASSDIFLSLVPEEFRSEHEQPLSYHDYAQQQCDWYNSSEGCLEGIDCPECKNRGYFQFLDAEDNKHMKECKCMTARRYATAMLKSGLGDLYRHCTFDSYIAKESWQVRSKKATMKYAAQDGNAWLLLAGASGCGKTHLGTAVCAELAMRGREVKYVQWKRLYDKLVQTRFKETEQDEILMECIEYDVLYIDDFLKMPGNIDPTPDMLSYALEIIDARYKADKRTILSTEFFVDEIISFDEALGGRIREKTVGNKIMNKREQGRNYRMRDTVSHFSTSSIDMADVEKIMNPYGIEMR